MSESIREQDSTDAKTVCVLGSTGFIGTNVTRALQDKGAAVIPVRAPRIEANGSRAHVDVRSEVDRGSDIVNELVRAFDRADVVINAAGVSNAQAGAPEVFGANAVLPAVVAAAVTEAGTPQFVHLSSAAVQGRGPLDERWDHSPFSPYSASKAAGEAALRGNRNVVVFRPTSVHGRGRSVTSNLVRFASSGLSSVAGDGQLPTPQVLVENVADAVAFVALSPSSVPEVVLQPSEGHTTASILRVLGGRGPKHIPVPLARGVVTASRMAAARSARLSATSRRLEMLWFGQLQCSGWLSKTGWTAPYGGSAWEHLAHDVRAEL